MSEYQYYEFLAIDRPLTKAQMEAVGKFSTRAEITATRFSNEYHWGDFRGDEREFLKKYYDAFMYYANWGTRRFAFTVPGHAIEKSVLKAYCPGDEAGAEMVAAGDKYIVDLVSQNEDVGDYFEEELSSIVAAREEVIGGDLRPLYLGWLIGAQSGELDDDVVEPPVPAGMKKLSASQNALADFLLVDDDLIHAAAQASDEIKSAESQEELIAWLMGLPQAEKDGLLREMVAGDDPQALGKLRSRFRDSRREPTAEGGPRRTVGELRKAMERVHDERSRVAQEKTAREKARDAEKAKAQQAYLTQLAGRQKAAWAEVEEYAASKQSKNYDLAVTLLNDLRKVAEREKELPRFGEKLAALLLRHARKPKFCEKIRKMRLMPDAASAC